MTPTRSTRRNRVVVIAVAAVLVVTTAGAVALAAGRSGSSGESNTSPTTSPTLHLARTQTSTEALLTSTSAQQGGSGTGGSYVLSGTLPAGPSEGVVIDPSGSTASLAQVTALTKALGFTKPPKQVDGGWSATEKLDGEWAYFDLDETGGNVWAFGRGQHAICGGSGVQPGQAANPDTVAQSCPAISTSPKWDHEPAGRAALVRDAAGVFTAVGVTPGKGLVARDANGTTTLAVPLTIEDLPVVQVALTVSADTAGIASANGWLDPKFSTVGSYPLVTAQQALTSLDSQPKSLACQVPTPGTPTDQVGGGCVKQRTQKVTSARLAWLPSRNDGHTVLVPAWQFEVDGFFDPAIVAVEPSYLGEPTPAGNPEPGTPSSVPGSTGSAVTP